MAKARVLREVRSMRFEEICERWTESRLTQEEAAQILGCASASFGVSAGVTKPMQWMG